MFRWYGLAGMLLIVLAEINFIAKIQPFADWYFPIVWFGYILVIDSLVYKLKKDSLITNRLYAFIGMLILSALFWWLFEITNISLNNWSYHGGETISTVGKTIFKFLSFSTVLPAFFETAELFRSIHLFDHAVLKKKHHITKRFLHTMMVLGCICFFLAIFFPLFAFPLIWLSFFLFLDPINYLHKQPSVVGHLKDRKLAIPLSLLAAGIVMGVLWEFWNYWALHKWTYSIPYVGFFKIFEMPILGYLGYFPFALELYAMYWFTRSLFTHKEHLLE